MMDTRDLKDLTIHDVQTVSAEMAPIPLRVASNVDEIVPPWP